MRLFQFLIEIFKVLKDPDDSKIFFPKSISNQEMFDLYKNDRLTYFSIAKTTTEAQPKLKNPRIHDGFLDSIDL